VHPRPTGGKRDGNGFQLECKNINKRCSKLPASAAAGLQVSTAPVRIATPPRGPQIAAATQTVQPHWQRCHAVGAAAAGRWEASNGNGRHACSDQASMVCLHCITPKCTLRIAYELLAHMIISTRARSRAWLHSACRGGQDSSKLQFADVAT
jgi:hypothetical protein